MMQQTPVDNGREKKSASASPAEIAKKAANKTRDLWGDMEAGELESIFLSAIKEATQPLQDRISELVDKDTERTN